MRIEDLNPVTTLGKNGLRLCAIRMPNVHHTVVEACLRVGSRYESRENNGISHFLEHMLYRGTPSYPSAHQLALGFERLGGTLEAATSVDHGTMAIGVPEENLARAISLFGEAFSQPVFDGIEIERGIVHSEILEGLDERGRVIDADTLLRQLSFGDHPLGYPVTGSAETLEHFSRPLLSEHHRRHYHAGGTVVVAAGQLDPEQSLKWLERTFSELDPGPPTVAGPPEAQSQSRFQFVRHAESQTAVRVGFRAPGDCDKLEPAIELLLRILDDGLSTRLYHEICDRRGLCYDVSAGYEVYSDCGVIDLAADTAHEKASEVLRELFNIIVGLRDEGPSDEEFEACRARYRWQLNELLDSAGDVAEMYAYGELMGTARTPLERREQLDAVSRQQVREAAEMVFQAPLSSVVVVGLQSKRAQEELRTVAESFR